MKLVDMGGKMNNLTKTEFMNIYNEGKNLTDKPIFIKFFATW
jgi:hypothetical protein